MERLNKVTTFAFKLRKHQTIKWLNKTFQIIKDTQGHCDLDLRPSDPKTNSGIYSSEKTNKQSPTNISPKMKKLQMS